MSMPALGLGTWQLRGSACTTAVGKALELGYRHIDTAEMYGNEAETGVAIAASGIPRSEIFVTTKLWRNHLGAREVGPALAASLKRLRTDYVDLLLIHWPSADTPLAETLAAMAAERAAGRARAIGVSNFPAPLLREAIERHGAPIACDQVEYHVRLDQGPLLDYARARGVAVVAYSPLGQGGLARDRVLAGIGAKYGKTAAQVALRWLVEQPGIAAIPKASGESNLRRNLEVFDFALDAQDREVIAALR